MTESRLEPFFLQGEAGRIFCLLRAAKGARQCVLIVPPFGEELNKARRQFTITAQALVKNGYAVLLLDLFGTGDSEGDFKDATWPIWKADTIAALSWIENKGFSLAGIVALRLGCALAAESLRDSGHHAPRTVFWQPVSIGQQFMAQFLRLRVAASMMESGNKESISSLKQRLLEGATLEIAGYALTPNLYRAIERIDLPTSLTASIGNLSVIEVGRTQSGDLSPAGKHLLAASVEYGDAGGGTRIDGAPFWSATEIVVNHALTLCTVHHFTGELS